MIYSPLSQFEVIQLISLNLFGSLYLSITNLSLYTLYISTTVIGLNHLANNDFKLLPNKASIALETFFASIVNMVKSQVGSNKEIYVPFIYTLFSYVLIGNLISNIPYSFAVNASAIVSLGISFAIFLGVTILAVYRHKLKFFSFFIPGGTPLALVPLLVLIEFISYLARAVSLGVRLFANICAGHSLLKILSTFLYKLFSNTWIVFIFTLIPFTVFLGLVGLELAVSFIQSFVLSLLVCSYLKDALDLH